MKRDDTLWKGILEDLIIHFLHFFFEEAIQSFDLKKGVEFLDKEMEQISQADELESPKFVDKLVKVFTNEGSEQWVLIHVEVQGYKDLAFEDRIFVYYYRIFDRYRKRIAVLVILSDEFKSYHPTQYYSEYLGTEISFRFKTYKVLDQNEEELERSKNPFAFVILTVLLALKKRKKDKEEEDLLQLKIGLTRRLLESKFSKPVIRGIYYFIRNYVVFENKENVRKFDTTIDSITDNNKSMGIVEMLVERGKNAIREAAREEGLKEGIEEGKALLVKNILAANKFTDAEIANFTGVTEEYVREIKKA